MFAKTESFWGRGQSTAVYGILLIVFGPIGTRILYELTMIAIMQLKNTMEINAKIKGDAGAATNLFGMPKTSHDFVSNIANSVRQAAAPVQSQPQQMYNNAAPAQPQQMYNAPVAQPAPAPQQSAPAPEVPVAQETPAEITCPNCGATVVADATFCDKCGTKLK